MFCRKCGKEMGNTDTCCKDCGANVTEGSPPPQQISSAYSGGSSADEAKSKTAKNVVKGCALGLCVLFFILPLVQCSHYTELTASGWEIATGTGDMYEMSRASANPLVFALVIMPAILAVLAFANKPFSILRNASLGGLATKFLFIMGAYIMLNTDDYKGYFSLTGFNLLVLAIYIGLCVFTHNYIKYDDAQWYATKAKRQFMNHNIPPKICEKCHASYASDVSSCPKCGFRPAGAGGFNPTHRSSWICEGCNTRNDSSQFFCKDCGAIK